jgi:hypothetical protein
MRILRQTFDFLTDVGCRHQPADRLENAITSNPQRKLAFPLPCVIKGELQHNPWNRIRLFHEFPPRAESSGDGHPCKPLLSPDLSNSSELTRHLA